MIGKNNPFNIRYNPRNTWIGQSGQTRGFVDFDSKEHGIRAVCVIVLKTYRKRGVLSIEEIISTFAPDSENDTRSYINYVCSKCGLLPFDVPSKVDEFVDILVAMSYFEGNPLFPYQIYTVLDKYKIKPYVSRKKRV